MADKGLDIVDKYNLEVVQVSRGRGAQVLHTADGLYIRNIRGGEVILMMKR